MRAIGLLSFDESLFELEMNYDHLCIAGIVVDALVQGNNTSLASFSISILARNGRGSTLPGVPQHKAIVHRSVVPLLSFRSSVTMACTADGVGTCL